MRPTKVAAYREMMGLDELRTRLRAMPNLTDFARFAHHAAETAGLRNYTGETSARVAMAAFRDGGGLLEWSHILLDHALRQWDRVESQKAAAALPRTDTENGFQVFKETFENVALVGVETVAPPVADAAAVTLRVDVPTLVETLARFGIRVELEGGQP